jgi:hypothetical protein
MKRIKILLIVLAIMLKGSYSYSQTEKEKKFPIFINNLIGALQSKDMTKIKNYVIVDENSMAIELIEYRIKNKTDLADLIQALRKKPEKFDVENWEKVINHVSQDELMAIYFSYKQGQWKIAEIATGPND